MSGASFVLRRLVCDIIAIVPIIVVSSVVYALSPFQRGYFKDDLSLKYPYRPSTVPNVYLYTVCPIITILIIIIVELFRAHNYGFSRTYKGVSLVLICNYKFIYLLGFGYAVTSAFVHIGKVVVGELRPNFFDVCGPTPVTTTSYGYVSNFTCTKSNQHEIDEMRLSFPSGHSAYTMFPAVFISVYLYYRMPHIPVASVLQAFLQVAAITAAFYVGLTRVTDNKHHPHDVLAGFLIGAVVAIFCVRYATDVHELDDAEQGGLDEPLLPALKNQAPEMSLNKISSY
ncbi:hypothetical protein Aperf_G00000052424 [Anoplocephala perfoliata]